MKQSKTAQDAWLEKLRNTLDASVDQLDAATLSKLNQARHKALQNRHQRNRLQFNHTASAFAGVAALAVLLWWQMPTSSTSIEPDLWQDFDQDLNIMADSADLDFYQQLDFYNWLDGADAEFDDEILSGEEAG